jgi:FlaA1/EpsC-like NDP-sugar epimerase
MRRISSIRRDLIIIGKSIWLNLSLFTLLLLLGAAMMQASNAYPGATYIDSVIDAFHMTLLERVAQPGDGIVPQVLTFVMPLFSVVILGEGVMRVLAVYLRRGENREEWDRMVAQTFSEHTVICGVGELGRALFKRLTEEDPDMQIIIIDTRPSIMAELGADTPNVCHVQADMTSLAGLEAANCRDAKVIVMASGNDAYNMEAALKALQLNPGAKLWVRLYRIGLASLMDLGTKPNVHFFSPYERAAEALVSSVTGI